MHHFVSYHFTVIALWRLAVAVVSANQRPLSHSRLASKWSRCI